MKIEMSISTLQTDKFIVSKSEFIAALVYVYTEIRFNEISELEKMMKNYQDITEEIFVKLIKEIDSSITSEFASKLFNDAVLDTNDITFIKPNAFIQMIMAYGIGGYGIGPFKRNELNDILQSLLNANKNKKRDEENKIDLLAVDSSSFINMSPSSPRPSAGARIPVSSAAFLAAPSRAPKIDRTHKSVSPFGKQLARASTGTGTGNPNRISPKGRNSDIRPIPLPPRK